MDFILENYNWWRAGHIIFVIFWVAALMFLPRKFVYQFQVDQGSKQSKSLIEQQKKLINIIMNPAAIGTWLFGSLLILVHFFQWGSLEVFIGTAWAIKLLSISAMSCFHIFYLNHHKKFAEENRTYSEKFWRALNEAPAVLVVLIVIVAVVYI